ncbi:MAG: cell wall-binding repeat-containing protein [Actinomycetota bacterium]|nr:cell wall-binding repeat-containing protein [Actinomycetota bacterium]
MAVLPSRLASLTAAATRRAAALAVCALLWAAIGSGVTPAAAASQAITSSGPLTRVEISDQLNCAVNHTADEQGEFFGDTACGTFLATGGTLFSPASLPAGGSAVGTPFTPVSQSPVTGDGTAADPFQIVTVVDLGATGLRITQTDSYVVGQESYRTDVEVANTTAAEVAAILWRAGDCFLQDSDTGFGAADPASGAVACVAPDPENLTVPGERIEQWLPLSGDSSYFEAGYSEVWGRIGAQQPFDDTCRCDELIDNGAGLSWALQVPANSAVVRSHLTTFSPLGQVPLATTKTADEDTSEPGGTNGYTITVSNPNDQPVALATVFDELPEGFTYVAGSTTGLTSAEPQISGQTLTWENPGSVPANASEALHFQVEVFGEPGTYLNNAGATSPAFAVTATGNTAPITVGDLPEGPTERLRGLSRIETAVEASQESFPQPGTATVVLARSDVYPDALAGAPLARLRDAPLLLTTSSSLHPATRDEINRLGATNAILLGGEQALLPQVGQDLLAQTTVTDVERVAGPSRFHTAAAIAERVGGTAVYVADGFAVNPRDGWPDALAVSPLAAFQSRPILLVDTQTLPSATSDALRELNVTAATIAGGIVAVSDDVADAVEDEGVTVDRVAGETRYETARALADVAIEAGMSPTSSWLASGENWPDALVTGPAAAKADGILMLVHPTDLDNSPPAREYVTKYRATIEQLFLMGGSAAITDRVEQQLAAILTE